LLERERTAHIGVQHEEAVWAALENGITEVIETTSGSQRLVLAEVLYADLRVCARAILDKLPEDGLVVVADDEDLADLWHAGDSGEAMLDDRVAGDFEERLRLRSMGVL
jgi:hypothetical protein